MHCKNNSKYLFLLEMKIFFEKSPKTNTFRKFLKTRKFSLKKQYKNFEKKSEKIEDVQTSKQPPRGENNHDTLL